MRVEGKFVSRVGRARQRFYRFTAIDEATRYRILRISDHNNMRSAVAFLNEIRRRLPLAPQVIWHVADLGIAHRHIPPGSPAVNGKVERSHKTDAEQFYRGKRFRNRKELARRSQGEEYNERRPHLALKGQTPAERVRELARHSPNCQEPSQLVHTSPTRNMAGAVRAAYEAVPAPKLVVAVGGCGCSGGIFADSHAVVGAVDVAIPVDGYIPGCPPTPAMLVTGILQVLRSPVSM